MSVSTAGASLLPSAVHQAGSRGYPGDCRAARQAMHKFGLANGWSRPTVAGARICPSGQTSPPMAGRDARRDSTSTGTV